MIDRLTESFAFRQEVLKLRDERQKVLAANIANADTPHYKARDFDFKSELSRALDAGQQQRGGSGLAVTSERHIQAARTSASGLGSLQYRIPDQPSLDGNTVNMERERAHFADNSVRYQASLTFMRSYIQGMKTAMKPE